MYFTDGFSVIVDALENFMAKKEYPVIAMDNRLAGLPGSESREEQTFFLLADDSGVFEWVNMKETHSL